MDVSVRVLSVALALGAAQTTPPAQRFKSSVDIVQVDVSAVDGNGRPVRDLTAADFELTVDGRARRIVSAQFVAASAPVLAAAPAAPAHYSSNVALAGGRLIMVVVDRSSIASGRGRAAIESASRFVTRLNPADRVALATIPNGPQVPFTADHALVQRLLQQVDGIAEAAAGSRNIGIADAMAFERKDPIRVQAVMERECGVPNVGESGRGGGQSDSMICMSEVRQEAGVVAADARERARNSIRGLQALIEGLAPSQTPKILVYISEGMVVDREATQLSWLEAKAAASHITIYPLFLQTSEFDASQRRPQMTYAADRALQEQGLATIAQASRGDVFRVMSNSDFAFERLSNELSGYYLLGFEPDPQDRNERPHAINVSVRRRGVTVRSRRQFTIGTEAARTPHAEIVAALRDPLLAAEIPVKVTSYSFRGSDNDNLRLVIAADIDRSINPEGQFSIGYVVVDFNGRLAASEIDIAMEPARKGARVGQFFRTIAVGPGKYTIKLVAVDDARRRGSVERVVQAQLTTAGPIRATDLLIADGAGRAGDLPLTPVVGGEIAGGTLQAYLELFADAPEPLEPASVTLEVAESDSAPALEHSAAVLRTPECRGRCRIAEATVDVSRLAPGGYVARAVISMGSRSVGRVTRPFTIVRRSARP